MCILALPFDHPEAKKGRTLGYVELLKEYMQAIEEVDSIYPDKTEEEEREEFERELKEWKELGLISNS
jgi:hypothetical protein